MSATNPERGVFDASHPIEISHWQHLPDNAIDGNGWNHTVRTGHVARAMKIVLAFPMIALNIKV